MKTVLISYANKPFYKSQAQLKKSALLHGVDEVWDYTDVWLTKQQTFYKNNSAILQQPRGNGFWLWKPFIVLDALSKLQEGDTLIYVDAGATVVAPFMHLAPLLSQQPILLFYNNGHLNKTWTKRDCFYLMDADTATFHDGFQVAATFVVFKKCDFVQSFIAEWLHFATNENIITDAPNICGLPNIDGFIDHRHDQSVLSILAIKHQLTLYRDICQWGNKYKLPEWRVAGEFNEGGYVDDKIFTNSPYPTIIDSHRNKLPLTLSDKLQLFLKRFIIFK